MGVSSWSEASNASARLSLTVLIIDCDLANANWQRRSFTYEILGLGQEEPSFDHTRHSRSSCRDRVSDNHYFRANLVAFAVAIFLVGLLPIAFRLEKTAYRYASITLTIIVLIPRSAAPWIVALNRFIEVSVGIIVALAVVAVWPEQHQSVAKITGE